MTIMIKCRFGPFPWHKQSHCSRTALLKMFTDEIFILSRSTRIFSGGVFFKKIQDVSHYCVGFPNLVLRTPANLWLRKDTHIHDFVENFTNSIKFLYRFRFVCIGYNPEKLFVILLCIPHLEKYWDTIGSGESLRQLIFRSYQTAK